MPSPSNIIPIVESGQSFSPFYFYTEFLPRVAEHYSRGNRQPAEFILCSETGIESLNQHFHFDPITLPLLIGLGEQLKKYHENRPIKLHLINTPGTVDILEFLKKADFFSLTGPPNVFDPIEGRQIFDFDKGFLGSIGHKSQHELHRVREYSLSSDNLIEVINKIESDEGKRDALVEYYSYLVQDHFEQLLFENAFIGSDASLYVEILSELITNGVLHSKSNVYALMFSDRFRTKFSISDNGIGLAKSLQDKAKTWYFDKKEFDEQVELLWTQDIPLGARSSILGIFEALFFSMLKERHGLFDLMCNVIISDGGYVRIHNEAAQIILSNRMIDELNSLNEIRTKLVDRHNQYAFERITEIDYKESINVLSKEAFGGFMKFISAVFAKYSEDVKFSALRIFKVRFRGVHVEVEIPNSI